MTSERLLNQCRRLCEKSSQRLFELGIYGSGQYQDSRPRLCATFSPSSFFHGALRQSFLTLSFVVLFPAIQAMAKNPVILSTDVGNEIDDQWAIVYLLTSPEFEVLGIVSAHAPTVSPPAAHMTYRILLGVVENRLNMTTHPPLFEGANLPLEDLKMPRPSPAADFIVQASKPFSKDNRLTLLMIGAVTDAASAILADPSIVDRIRIVAMGFKSWPDGGDEFNVANVSRPCR